MTIAWDIHTGGYTTLDQPVRYRAGRAVAYRCASCGDWHPWGEKLRDPETGLLHGIDCESPEYVAAEARRRAERSFAAAASRRAGRAA